jgi:hypothetical protein
VPKTAAAAVAGVAGWGRRAVVTFDVVRLIVSRGRCGPCIVLVLRGTSGHVRVRVRVAVRKRDGRRPEAGGDRDDQAD